MYDCDFPEMELDGYIRHLRDDAYDKKIPFKGVFELTPRCNFNCNAGGNACCGKGIYGG